MDTGIDGETTRVGNPYGRDLQRLMHGGRSFSGKERDCLFLHTGGERWAWIATAAGVDLDGDGRGAAVCDWDQDGDQDLWVVNRSGPQVQFLRNEMPAPGHFVALRLAGVSANRDAIGARVELTLAGGAKRIHTVHAGEGYLGQSSRWLHFGLGATTEIERVTVRWPGGEIEAFTGVAADARWLLRQGDGKAASWTVAPRTVVLEPARLPAATGSLAGRTFFAAPVILPPLPITDFAGAPQPWPAADGTPLLVNLWASWCKPCLAELREFRDQAAALQQLHLRVLPIAVNGLGEDKRGVPEDARRWLEQEHMPFPQVRATADLLDRVEMLLGTLFDLKRPIPVPTSLLVDGQGRLAAVYRGPVTIAQLREDVGNLSADGETRRRLAVPFPGRWHSPLPVPPLRRVADRFYEVQHFDQARAFYEAAIAADPKDGVAEYNVGMVLDLTGQPSPAEKHFRRALELLPNDATVNDAMAMVLGHLQRPDEGLPFAEKAVSLRADFAEAHNTLGILRDMTGQLEPAEQAYLKALALNPNLADASNNLGLVLAQQGRIPEAEARFRHAIKLQPDYAHAHFALARILAIQERYEDSLHEIHETRRSDPNYPIDPNIERQLERLVKERARGK